MQLVCATAEDCGRAGNPSHRRANKVHTVNEHNCDFVIAHFIFVLRACCVVMKCIDVAYQGVVVEIVRNRARGSKSFRNRSAPSLNIAHDDLNVT